MIKPMLRLIKPLLVACALTNYFASQLPAELTFHAALSHDGPTSLAIYSAQGVKVRTLWDATQAKTGQANVAWDLRDDDGQPVAPGTYQWRAVMGASVVPRYVATVANGRHPQVQGDLGGVEGMGVFDVVADHDGTIFTSGWGHGKSVQKVSPDGKQRPKATNLSAVEVVSALALNDKYVFVAGDEGFYRLDKKTMKHVRWPSGELVHRFVDKPKWTIAKTPGERVQHALAMRDEAIECVGPSGENDPRVHAWQGITRHPMTHYEGGRIIGAAVWDDRLYLSDRHYDRVLIYSVDTGELVGTWDDVKSPAGIAVRDGRELLVITDGKVVARDRDGQHRGNVVTHSLIHPMGLAVGPGGRVYVTDLAIPNQLKVFSRDGLLERAFGRAGTFAGKVTFDKLGVPRGVAVDRDGNVILSEFAYNRVQKLSPELKPVWDLQAFYCYLGTADQTDPQWIYAFEGPMLPVIKQFHIDYDTGKWDLTRAWYFHKYDDAGSYYGYPSTGGGAVTLDGHKFVYVQHKTMRIYRLEGDDLVPVVRIGPRVSYERPDGSIFFFSRDNNRLPARLFIWHDDNHDRRVFEREVDVLPLEVVQQRNIYYRGTDGDIDRYGNVYMGNMVFKMQGVVDGIPRYDWDHLEVMNLSLPNRPVNSFGVSGMGVDDAGNRYYAVSENHAGNPDFPGLTFWAKRQGWQHVAKYTPDGTLLWRAGRKAIGKVFPGSFSYVDSVDWAGGFVFVADMDGYVHVFTDDGLFVTRMFSGVREGADQDKDPYAITSNELGHVKAITHPRTGQVHLISQSLEGGEHVRVYTMDGLGDVVRNHGTLAVRQADVADVAPVALGATMAAKPRDNLPHEVPITSVLAPPVVDGKLTTWTQLVTPAQIQTDDGATTVDVYLRYDEKYLYIGARCTGDESPAKNAQVPDDTEFFWRGDCINLFINTDPNVDRKRSTFGPGDDHIFLPISGRFAGKPLLPYSRQRSQYIKDAQYRVAVVGTDTWTMTGRIAWSELGDYIPNPGDTLHINVQIDFASPKGDKHLYSLYLGGKGRSYADPRNWNCQGKITYAR